MSGWEGAASTALAAAAVVLAICLVARTRSWDPAVPVLLDLLLAAVLLRLGATDSWPAIGAAAAVVAARTLWQVGVRRRGPVVRHG